MTTTTKCRNVEKIHGVVSSTDAQVWVQQFPAFLCILIAAGMQVVAVICRGPGSFIGSISLRIPHRVAALPHEL
jgi:hypothetical protein